MSAPADKVQLILQNLLQQSLPLVHKGIFTKNDLKQIMVNREKHQNSMQKSTYRLPDYLKAIEYQYSLERQRLHTVDTADLTKNPHFKKQSKNDFALVKRIIRLWDRTMHKYRYRVDLWKQYLSFALAINSKKIFYKALSNGLKFLPFNEDLWKIGVRYEVQINANLWKARKLYMKAVRVNHNRIGMWTGFMEFEIEFMRRILQREQIIKGSEGQQGIKFVVPEQGQQPGIDAEQQEDEQKQQQPKENYQTVNLQNHHQVIWLIVEQAFQKCQNQTKQQIVQEFENCLYLELQKVENQVPQIQKVLKQLVCRIKELKMDLKRGSAIKSESQLLLQEQSQDHVAISAQNLRSQKIPINKQEQLEYYRAWVDLFANQNRIQWAIMSKGLLSFCLKPDLFAELSILLLNIYFEEVLDMLRAKFSSYTFSEALIIKIIQGAQKRYEEDNRFLSEEINKFIQTKIKGIPYKSFIDNAKLLKAIIGYNKSTSQIKENNSLHRSLSISCKTHPQTIQLCARLIKESF